MKPSHQRRVLIAAFLSLAPALARAKVVFTGYGDLRYNAGLNAQISGTPATVSAFGLKSGGLSSRAFSADAIGLFATTEVQENLQFLTDISFRNISGNQVNQLTLQYAYLDWTPLKDTAVKGGKVTIPFGYFNENRFYAFERYNITPPIFQTGILGLPIADWGVSAQQRFPMSLFTVAADAYVVNGYGNSGTNGSAIRLATLPGGLTLANNIRASDNNHKPSVGGRVQLTDIGGAPVETGVSYYWGYWDASALEPMHLAGAHLHAKYGGFDFLAEVSQLEVRGDNGFVSSIGDHNWTTNGGFAIVSYDAWKVQEKTLAPYVQGELYRTHPNNENGQHETLRSVSAGAALKAGDHLTFKAEYLHFVYELPDVQNAGALRLSADGALLSVVVTF